MNAYGDPTMDDINAYHDELEGWLNAHDPVRWGDNRPTDPSDHSSSHSKGDTIMTEHKTPLLDRINRRLDPCQYCMIEANLRGPFADSGPCRHPCPDVFKSSLVHVLSCPSCQDATSATAEPVSPFVRRAQDGTLPAKVTL